MPTMTEPTHPDGGDLSDLEDYLADQWHDLRPIDGADLDRTLRELVDICGLLGPVDAGSLYVAAEARNLGESAAVLRVLAGLAEHLAGK
jgi:hypothetical protein